MSSTVLRNLTAAIRFRLLSDKPSSVNIDAVSVIWRLVQPADWPEREQVKVTFGRADSRESFPAKVANGFLRSSTRG